MKIAEVKKLTGYEYRELAILCKKLGKSFSDRTDHSVHNMHNAIGCIVIDRCNSCTVCCHQPFTRSRVHIHSYRAVCIITVQNLKCTMSIKILIPYDVISFTKELYRVQHKTYR